MVLFLVLEVTPIDLNILPGWPCVLNIAFTKPVWPGNTASSVNSATVQPQPGLTVERNKGRLPVFSKV